MSEKDLEKASDALEQMASASSRTVNPKHQINAMSQTSLKKESDALQQILDSLAHLLINPSRLTFPSQYELGFGPNNEVSLATLDGSSKVLVKRLRLIQSSGALDMVRMATRFARALKISAKANHPNILRPISYHLSSNYCIAQLVSPYMVNGNINQYMLRDQTGIEVRLCFVRSIASGLAYLHSCDPPICHGALRPANVLINEEPDVVLCDFGLTTFVEDWYAESGISTSQSLKGTINYVSPEIFQEVKPEHTLQSDVWAWACTAFEIITGYAPYSVQAQGGNIPSAPADGNLPGRVELLGGLVPESNKPFYESLEVLRSAFLDCWSLNPDERPLISSVLRDLSSLPRARSLLLQQQAAGRVERSQQITSQLAIEIQAESLLDHVGRPQIEAVICPPTQDHQTWVHDISFAPDGKWLATCLHDQLPKLWNLEKDFDWLSPFPEANGRFLWSPDSQYLALIGKQGLHIWAKKWATSEFYSTNTIGAITWLSNGDLVITSEQRIYVMKHSEGWKMEPQSHCIDARLKINEIASIPSDREGHPRIVLMAAGVATANSLFGSAPYDVDNQNVVGDLLLTNTPQHITVTPNGEFAILSVCESEWKEYLELWSIEMASSLEEPLCFKFFHRYHCGGPDHRLSQAGRAIAADEKLVMATFRNGATYLWETMSKRASLAVKRGYGYKAELHEPVVSFYNLEEGARLACGLGNGKVVIWKW